MNSPSPISSETLFTAIDVAAEHLADAIEDDLGHGLPLLPSGESLCSETLVGQGTPHASLRAPSARRYGRVPAARRRRPAAPSAPDLVRAGATSRSPARIRSKNGVDRRCGRSRRRAPRGRRAVASGAGGSRSRPSRRPRRPAGRRPRARRRRRRSPPRTRPARARRGASRRCGRSTWPPSPAAVVCKPKCAGTARSRAVFLPAAVLGARPRATRPGCRARRRLPSRRRSARSPGSGDAAVRRDGGAVRAVAAHDADAPRAVGPGAQHRERVVAQHRPSSVQPFERIHRRSRRSSTGRSAPARQNTPRSATGRRSGSRPASTRGVRDRDADRHQVALLDVCCISHVRRRSHRRAPGPRRGPCRRAEGARRRLFEPPPSTARMAARLVTAGRPARRSSRTSRRCSRSPRSSGRCPRRSPPGHVWSRTTAPSPCASTPSTASCAIVEPVRYASQSSSSTCQCTLR